MRAIKLFFLFLFLTSPVNLFANAHKRALVAGGAGFLGSNLCSRLLNENYKVVCVDNFLSSTEKNIVKLQKNPLFTFLLLDVCELKDIEGDFDEIYNLACPASPIKYQKNPIHTLKTNFLGTLNLLELAKRKKAVFFQASTSEVYGDPLVHPQKESYWGNVNPIGIRACYDEGKRVAETLCFEYYRQHGVSVKVARIFNTYGPNMAQDDGRVVSNFILQAIQNKPLTIYGTGLQTRSFCFVDDLIEGFRRFVNTPSDCTGPINLGNPSEVSVKDFASFVKKKTSSSSLIEFFPLPQDDPTMRRPDITKAERLLKWKPRFNIDEGISKTISYFQGQN